jgi:hypothetical protein
VSFLDLRSLVGLRRPSPTRAVLPYRPILEPLEDRLLLSHAVPYAGESETPAEDATDGFGIVTYDVSPGSRLDPLLAAPSPQALPAATSAVWAEAQASDIPGRAWSVARQIARNGPDAVALQEAAIWTINGVPRYDFLALLRRDLWRRGTPYVPVVRSAVSVFQLPDATGEQIGLTDQTVILVNAGIWGRDFHLGHRAAGVFAARRTATIGGASGTTLSVEGTWASVNLINDPNPYHSVHLVTADLDPVDPNVNAAQGAELIAGPLRTSMPVILAGDFGFLNQASYQEITQDNYSDTWLRYRAFDPGLTGTEPSLSDPVRSFQARTDFVFIKVLLGTGPSDRTLTGLWPSDHAGVAVSLNLP